MKQALVVDRNGGVGAFAASALRPEYELTTVESLHEALALVSNAPYHLVMIAQPDLCPVVLWRMVESIKHLSSEATLVFVQAAAVDKDFYAHAQKLGVIVLTSPLGVAARTAIQEATLG